MNEHRGFVVAGRGGPGKSTMAMVMTSIRLEVVRSAPSERAGRASWIRRAQEQPWRRGSHTRNEVGFRG